MAYLNVGRLKLTAKFVSANRSAYVLLSSATKVAFSTVSSTEANAVSVNESIKTLADLPGPLSLPIIKATWTMFVGSNGEPMGKRIWSLKAEDIEKYGKIYQVESPGVNAVQLANPLDIATVMRNEPKYPKRFNSPIFDYYRENRRKKPGVFFSEGAQWHNYRSVISKRMLRLKEIAEYAASFNEIVTAFTERLRSIRESPGSEKEYEVQRLDNELFKWSFESVADVLFDKRFGCLEPQVNQEAQAFIQAIGEFLEETLATSIYPIWFVKIYEPKPVKKMFDSFDKMYKYAEMFVRQRVKEMEDREKMKPNGTDNEERMGFLEYLLSSEKLTKDDLLASVIDILFGGVDTTSNTMQWVLYMMAKNPDKQEILRQEVLSVLGDRIQASPTKVAQMPYLRAFVRETLRLYPPVAIFGRIAGKDLILSGYHIPAGTQLHFLVYHMGRDESVFEEPNAFKPERWLRGKERGSSKFNDAKEVFSSIPFGFGTRMCLGRRIAELELHLLLARIVQQFEIQYPPDAEVVEPYFRGVTIPDKPVRVKFVDRNM